MIKSETTIKELRAGLDAKEFSAREAAEFYLEEIKKKDGEIRAFLEVWEERALSEAEKADEEIGRGAAGVLTGVPLSVKDNILIQGREATGGSKILKGYRAEYDATVIGKLKEAGVVFLGRTNMDEFAFGGSTELSAYGPTHNPADLERVPGGTSGGSAAAVAAGMTVAALGSDTGGSIRQPASFCGVAGLRPTYGAVSRYGLMAAASSFDQIGPLTKTAADAKMLFREIADKDRFDSTSRDVLFDDIEPDKKKVKEFKLGIIKELWDEKKEMFKGVDERTASQIRVSMERLKKLGVDFKMVSLPMVEYALACYYISIFAEESSNMARFDGLRYGSSPINKEELAKTTLRELYLENKGQGFGEETKRRVILGTFVLSSGFYDAYYGKAQTVRKLIRRNLNKVLEEVEMLFLPTAPTVAYKIGEKIDDPLAMYYGDIFTVLASLTGSPALTLPVEKYGTERTGLPVGFQLVGRDFREADLLALGEVYEKLK